MFKILIALQGILNNNTYKCALTFKDITFPENYKVDIVFLAWKELKTIEQYRQIKIIYLDDPFSIAARDNKSFINLNRQIRTTAYLLDRFKNKYDYILKIRSDIMVSDSYKFKKEFITALNIPKIWISNIPTFSPRILNPIFLKYHFSDWFIGGNPFRLCDFLHLEEIDESKLIENTPFYYKNNIFWRKAQNEQLIWSTGWQKNSNKKDKLEILNKKIQKRSVKNSFKSAKYLNNNFYISPFLRSGLKSIKHLNSTLSWYKNSYSIFHINFLETFLINKGHLLLAVFYVPLIRYIALNLKKLFKNSKKIRF